MKNILIFCFFLFIIFSCVPHKSYCSTELMQLEETKTVHDIHYTKNLIENIKKNKELIDSVYFLKEEKYCLKKYKEQDLKKFITKNFLPLNSPKIKKDSLYLANIYGEDNGLDRFPYAGWLVFKEKSDTIYSNKSLQIWKINNNLYILNKTEEFKKFFKREK